MPVIAISNQKGGVGKTTTAINLSACLTEEGYSVLLIDMDPQGNATSGLGINKTDIEKGTYQIVINNKDDLAESCIVKSYIERLDLIPSNVQLAGAEIELINAESREYRLKAGIESLKDKYEYIIIDCPPSLGLLTINALCAANKVIMPVQCEYYALEGLGQLLEIINMVRNNLNINLELDGILLTMCDVRTNLSKQVEENIRMHFADNTYNTVIPRNIRLGEAPSFGKAIISYEPNSTGTLAYKQLTKEVINKNGQKSIR
jgi:chromosome partitioning protein